ncbi:hypothetical protein QEJ31_04160 [Pigmentibacter sp. JX0631]|uniref:DUF6588 family protein n=1 Tax=Pigmentibacter sp. JX0631 TaxID=2976982 RepID=UPI0024697D1A|nr:DUF6588 family protein [Pigmentibacter sp. JX0631]WGL60789.1 hypothetical protein QEJ31_04160 [Pigmentibacter sp. JX0631]
MLKILINYKYLFIFNIFFNVTVFADNNIDFKFTSSQIPDSDYENIVKPLINPTRFQFMSAPIPSSGKIIPLGISAGGGISYFTPPQSMIDSLNKYSDSANNFPNSIIIPRFIGKIGIPFGIDVAVNYAKVPQSTIEFYGIGGQFILSNPRVIPISLALRGGYTQINGFAPFDANSTNAELLLGVPLPILKPYFGGGSNWSNASTTFKIGNSTLTKSSSWNEIYGIIGFQIITILALDVEAQISPTQTIYNAKISLEI